MSSLATELREIRMTTAANILADDRLSVDEKLRQIALTEVIDSAAPARPATRPVRLQEQTATEPAPAEVDPAVVADLVRRLDTLVNAMRKGEPAGTMGLAVLKDVLAFLKPMTGEQLPAGTQESRKFADRILGRGHRLTESRSRKTGGVANGKSLATAIIRKHR